MDGSIDGRTDGRTDGPTDGWMDGWIMGTVTPREVCVVYARCDEVRIGKVLSDMFRIQNGLILAEALLPSTLNFDLECLIGNDQESWTPLEMNEK